MSASTSPAYGRSPGWPLIGRLPEVERIARARASGQPGVVLSGPAGVGKSRVARAAVEAAERDGARPAWAQATRSAATVPLGAFADLIPDDVRSDEPLELLRRSAEALQEHGGGRPVVLGVDDAQLLDPMSAALVLQIAMTATVFIVATVRAGEPCPDAIVSLWKDAGAVRLELGLLAEDETADLAEAIVGGPLEQAARRWAWSSSRGNALYVRELVGGAIEGGALEQVGELWRLPRRPSVSASLAELVTARMVGLGDGRARAARAPGARRAAGRRRARRPGRDRRAGRGRGARPGRRGCAARGAAGPSALRRGAGRRARGPARPRAAAAARPRAAGPSRAGLRRRAARRPLAAGRQRADADRAADGGRPRGEPRGRPRPRRGAGDAGDRGRRGRRGVAPAGPLAHRPQAVSPRPRPCSPRWRAGSSTRKMRSPIWRVARSPCSSGGCRSRTPRSRCSNALGTGGRGRSGCAAWTRCASSWRR